MTVSYDMLGTRPSSVTSRDASRCPTTCSALYLVLYLAERERES
jgi:hypothetical protein